MQSPSSSTVSCNSCHTALVAVSYGKTTAINCSSRPPLTTCWVTVGFTLIELSIVIVIIGLIVGGILVGRDMIATAQIRAQISQIEKYHQAVNTFKVKYGYLPGDIPDPTASGFGFAARGAYAGTGDGNSILEGIILYMASNNNPRCTGSGENLLFWEDLSSAKLIGNNFSTMTASSIPGFFSPSGFANYVPNSIINPKAIISTYSYNGKNYYALYQANGFNNCTFVTEDLALKINEAYAIDTKIDDGKPASGKVFAAIMKLPLATAGVYWYGVTPGNPNPAAAASAFSCYDNNNTAGGELNYTTNQNSGEAKNCWLSFAFQ